MQYTFRLCSIIAVLVYVLFPAISQAQTTLEPLLANLKNPDPAVRRKAAKEIGEQRFKEASMALADVTHTDKDPDSRAAAVEALGKIKNFETVPAIVETIKDTEAIVRRAAIRSLVSFYIEHNIGFIFGGNKSLNSLNPFATNEGSIIVEPYAQIDDRILVALAGAMRNDPDIDLRRSAIRALGVLRANSQVLAMAAALESDPDVRIDVLRVFIKLRDSENGVYAIPYFNDENREIRAQAIFTAGFLRTSKAVDQLNEVYQLGEDKRGFKNSINDFFKQTPERQRITLESLALIGNTASNQIFEKNLSSSDADRRQLANEGIARSQDTNFTEKISRNRLKEKNSSVKLSQSFALYKLGRPEFLDDVIKQLDALTLGDQAETYLLEVNSPSDLHTYLRQPTPNTAVRILNALGTIGTEESIQIIEPMLRNIDPRIVNAANLAIQRIKLRAQHFGDQPSNKISTPIDESPRPRKTKP